MRTVEIARIEVEDRRFPLADGAGTDAIHSVIEYGLAVTRLITGAGFTGTGIALTLGRGTDIVCAVIPLLAQRIAGREIEELMADFGAVSRALADDAELRWLGPHKGVVHLALASLTNACFDLWAKARGVPLWQLLLDLTPEQVLALLDLSYLENVLPPSEALDILKRHHSSRGDRSRILSRGYPGYDTSVGWFQYGDAEVRNRARAAIDRGFRALKLKVGSQDASRDLRRATMLREIAGPDCLLMLDANQQWTLEQAQKMCGAVRDINPFWIEEPTHPDDIDAHATLAREIDPIKIALGEHVPNRVVFKNFFAGGAVQYAQPDCTRLAGISEFLTVSLLARKYGRPVAPHVGDMGQIHQHLVLFNHIGMGHEVLFLEHIPHLRTYFVNPAVVRDGVYRTPQEAGASCDLKPWPLS
jgi:L-fuconate dehydratase